MQAQVSEFKPTNSLIWSKRGQRSDYRGHYYTSITTIYRRCSCLTGYVSSNDRIAGTLLKVGGHTDWIMHFGRVKGHAGIEGNELVDRG